MAGSGENFGTAEHKGWAGSGAAAGQEEAGFYGIFRFGVIGLGHHKNASCFDALRVLINPSEKAQNLRTVASVTRQRHYVNSKARAGGVAGRDQPPRLLLPCC